MLATWLRALIAEIDSSSAHRLLLSERERERGKEREGERGSRRERERGGDKEQIGEQQKVLVVLDS